MTTYIKLGPIGDLFDSSELSLHLVAGNASEVDKSLLSGRLVNFIKTGFLVEITKVEYDNIRLVNNNARNIPLTSVPVTDTPIVDPVESVEILPPDLTPGKRYLVGGNANGPWQGKKDFITYFDGSSWQFITPLNGMILPVWSLGISLHYTGTYPSGFWDTPSAVTQSISSIPDQNISAEDYALNLVQQEAAIRAAADIALQAEIDALGAIPIGSITAGQVGVVDSGNYYSGNNVELVLAQIGSTLKSYGLSINDIYTNIAALNLRISSLGSTSGSQIIIGSIDPTSLIGNNGDVYINTTTTGFWSKNTSGVWVLEFRISDGSIGNVDYLTQTIEATKSIYIGGHAVFESAYSIPDAQGNIGMRSMINPNGLNGLYLSVQASDDSWGSPMGFSTNYDATNSAQVLAFNTRIQVPNGLVNADAVNLGQLNTKEPLITAGTTAQYWRGDKSFQTLNTTVVPEGSNLYYTNARSINSVLTGYTVGAGTVVNTDSVLQALQKLDGNIALLTGSLVFKGTWNASTNSPTLTTSVGTTGWIYTVSVAGTTSLNGINQWNVGDKAVFAGGTWQKIDGLASEVLSVNSQVGNVVFSGGNGINLDAFTLAISLGNLSSNTTINPNGFVYNITNANASFYMDTSTTGSINWHYTDTTNDATGGYNSNYQTGTQMYFRHVAAGAPQILSFGGTNNSQKIVLADGVNSKGIEYAADYTANFTTRSLIDKGFADGRYILVTGGTYVTSVTSANTARITIAGTASAPTVDIASTYVGQASITTLGTITTGTWNGTSIVDTYISSASTWNAKQAALTGPGFVKAVAGVISYDNSTYLTTTVAASTYAPLSSPALTGVPTAPTATLGTNTTQLATTAFVIANAGTTSLSGTGYVKMAGSTPSYVASIPFADLTGVQASGTYLTPTSSNTVTNKDLTSGTNTFPTFNQNTSGTAANLSGTPALPNGTTATTQSPGDNTTKLATTAFVTAAVTAGGGTSLTGPGYVKMVSGSPTYITAIPLADVSTTGSASSTTYLRGDGAWTDPTTLMLALAGGTLTGTVNSRSIIPTTDNIYSLGTTSFRYNAVLSGMISETGQVKTNFIVGVLGAGANKLYLYGGGVGNTGTISISPPGTGTWANYDITLPAAPPTAVGNILTYTTAGNPMVWSDLPNYAFSSPTATTQTAGDNSTKVATTAFVTAAVAAGGGGGGTVTSVTSGNTARITIGGTSAAPTVDIAAAYVGQTSITTLGTITTGTWNGSVIAGLYGGTGVANSGKTITLGGNLTTSGAFNTTLTVTATTTVTLPTTGVIATLAGSEAFTNKDLTGAGNTFPTFNQNTTGSAAKWTTARTLAGNSVDGSTNVAFANKFIVQGTTDAGLSAAQFLGALGTGLVKNTTTTGVLSIAVSGTDYVASIPMTTLGDIMYGGASGVNTRLAGNTAASTKFLIQTGTGTVSAAPSWLDLFGGTNTWTGVQTLGSSVATTQSTADNTTKIATTAYVQANFTATSVTFSSSLFGGLGTSGSPYVLGTGIVGISNLSATGTPSSSTFLRGDNTWAAGGGGSGTVTSIVSSTGLNGGTITTTGTLSIDQSFTATWTGNHTHNSNGIGTANTDVMFFTNTTAASSGTTVQNTPAINFSGAAWNGTVTIPFNLRMQGVGVGGSGYGQFILSGSVNGGAYSNLLIVDTFGSFVVRNTFYSQTAGIGTTSTDSLVLQNTSAATSGAVIQYSGRIQLQGAAWTGSVSQKVAFIIEAQPVNGATITGNIVWSSSINAGAYVKAMQLGSDGTLSANHFAGLTSAPTVAAGTGAGTSPTVSTTGSNDSAIRISVATGTGTPAASATLCTVTFNKTYGTAPKVVLCPANAAAAALSGANEVYIDDATIAATTFILKTGPTGLAISTTYLWYAIVIH